ncbi:MAG: Nramp family divalent metal transporter [Firmicutes bacterium]|nr:Nramp family divalent metal transporter [Bacillota bacterium]
MAVGSKLRDHLRLRGPWAQALSPLRFLGPGMLVAVGFIDPGNWASNVAAGAQFGYQLLWVVTLSTFMLILLQHNAAHLGIVTGLCLSESATEHLPAWVSRPALGSAVLAAMATAFAEILGGAIALGMLFHLPLKLGACLTTVVVAALLLLNRYSRIEKLIVGFVSLIGLGFLFELLLVKLHWPSALVGWVKPSLPPQAITIVMSVLGAVVMPHNLFLHSEFIQSRQWNLQGDDAIRHHLRFEFVDTLISMIVGWAINSAMILLAAATFHQRGLRVESLEQAEAMLRPILGHGAAVVFALALLCAGIASSVTAGMAGGSIFAGLFRKPYEIGEPHTRWGVLLTLLPALAAVFFFTDTFQALVLSQVLLSIQLPITIVLQLSLTSSRRVMGAYANSGLEKWLLWIVAGVVIFLNLLLLKSVFFG